MNGPSKSKSIEDLENQLLLKNKDLTEKYLELETLLDLTNTINSLDDLDSLFFNVLTLSSSILNSSKGIVLIKNEVSNIFDPISVFNLDEEKIKKQKSSYSSKSVYSYLNFTHSLIFYDCKCNYQ